MPHTRARNATLTLVLAGAFAVAVAGCSSTVPPPTGVQRPPESPVVLSSGSVPPGYYAALAEGGIAAEQLACNSQNRYGSDLRTDARAAASRVLAELAVDAGEAESAAVADLVFWQMVRTLLVEGDNNNLGAVVLDGLNWTDEEGRSRPVVVFRSGLTPAPAEPGSCFDSLLTAGGVRHVVNLYDGEMVVDDLVDAERRTAAARGATYVVTADEGYGVWRDVLRDHGADDDAQRRAIEDLARLIREQVLAPDGEPPKGNILVHCGGGMHRSGMVVGVLQRAVNDDPWTEIETMYRYHVGYRSEHHRGGFEADNLEVIRTFDPAMLQLEPGDGPP